MQSISYEQARKNQTARRLDLAYVRMPFRLQSTDRFFFFGSCTARQMERAFRLRGLDVLSTSPAFPRDEVALGNHPHDRYFVPVLSQEIAWAFGKERFPTESLVPMPRNLWADLQFPTRARAVTHARALARRAEVERYFSRLEEATVAVIDLCGADLWFDRTMGLALNAVPPDWFARRHPERFEYQMWDRDDCYEALRALRQMIMDVSAVTRVIVTVNRQPLFRTFRPTDVTQAEAAEKSTLVGAAAKLVAECEDVAYFPIFEALSAMRDDEVYDAHDHVREELLDGAMAAMLHACGVYDPATAESDYDETAYLRANPDVSEAVRAGSVRSGYHHWYAQGRAQGRVAAALELAQDVPIEAGAMRVRLATKIPGSVPTDRRFVLEIELENLGPAVFETAGQYPVYLCYRWYDAAGTWTEIGHSVHTALPGALMPGESTTLKAIVATPKSAGRHVLAVTLLQQNVAWFDDVDPANGFRGVVVVDDWDVLEAVQ